MLGLEQLCRRALPVLFMCTALGVSPKAGALPQYLQAAQSAYSFKSGGAIDSAKCNLCHSGQTNANSLNLYGKDVKAALVTSTSKTVDVALIHSLDLKDSDGDGWPNALEFKADTLAGDPESKPSGTPPGAKNPRAVVSALNPFSLASFFYPKHAQHPILIHFPIALFVFSLMLDLLGIGTRNRSLHVAAYYNLIAAAVGGVLSVITGLLAWWFAFDAESLTGDPILLYHLILGVTTAVLLCILWRIRAKTPASDSKPLGNVYIGISVLTFAAITVTGHLGAIISGVVK